MDEKYWIARKRSAMAMARAAPSGETGLLHYELAGRHSIKAAECAAALAAQATPEDARAALHIPAFEPETPRLAQRPGGEATASEGGAR